MDKTDEQLVGEYLSGGEEALEILIGRYLSIVYNFIYRFLGEASEADDATQDTFLKVWKNIHRFDQSKKFRTWVLQIAKNTAYDRLKKRKPLLFSRLQIQEEYDIEANIPDELPLPDELADQRLTREKLDEVINELPLDYRSVVLLRLNDDLSFDEISAILEKPLNTIKSQYRRALKKMGIILSQAGMHQN